MQTPVGRFAAGAGLLRSAKHLFLAAMAPVQNYARLAGPFSAPGTDACSAASRMHCYSITSRSSSPSRIARLSSRGEPCRLQEYGSRRNRQVCMVGFKLSLTYVHGVMGSRLTRRSMAVGEFLRSNLHVVTIAVTAGAIVYAAVFLLSTMPPRSITMATGPEGGGYYEIGKQYQELLARTGVELRLSKRLAAWKTWRCCEIRTPA